MKALKFSILLCGLLFFINGTLTAQLIYTTPSLYLIGYQISMEGSVNTPQNGEPLVLSVTVSSNITAELAVDMSIIQGDNTYADSQSSGNLTAEHTFHMPVQDSSVVRISCGRIEGSSEYRTDGGCTITIIPGRTF